MKKSDKNIKTGSRLAPLLLRLIFPNVVFILLPIYVYLVLYAWRGAGSEFWAIMWAPVIIAGWIFVLPNIVLVIMYFARSTRKLRVWDIYVGAFFLITTILYAGMSLLPYVFPEFVRDLLRS